MQNAVSSQLHNVLMRADLVQLPFGSSASLESQHNTIDGNNDHKTVLLMGACFASRDECEHNSAR